jgi:hypothetical protein
MDQYNRLGDYLVELGYSAGRIFEFAYDWRRTLTVGC